MNFTYKKADLENTIKNFKVDQENNIINITFLDGSTAKMYYSKNNINYLIQKMIDDAIKRNNSNLENELAMEEKSYWQMVKAAAIGAILNYGIGLSGVKNAPNITEFSLGVATLFVALSIYGIIKIEDIKEKINDLVKYRRYLYNVKDCDDTTINEIDSLSLDDVVKLEKKKKN